jgi:hypothetical protein
MDMTNNKQQTAMQMAIAHYKKLSEEGSNQAYVVAKFLEETYLEMEKEQAIKLHYEYELYVMMNESDVMTFGQFYKQTYGGGEQ